MAKKKRKSSLSKGTTISPVVGVGIVLLVGLLSVSFIKNVNSSRNQDEEKEPSIFLTRGIRNPPRDPNPTRSGGGRRLDRESFSVLIKDGKTGKVVSGSRIEESKRYLVGLASSRKPNDFLPGSRLVGGKYSARILPPKELLGFKYNNYGGNNNVACPAVADYGNPCGFTSNGNKYAIGVFDSNGSYAFENKDFFTWDGANSGIVISYRLRGESRARTTKRTLFVNPSSVGNVVVTKFNKVWGGNVEMKLTGYGRVLLSGTNSRRCEAYLFEKGRSTPVTFRGKLFTGNTCSMTFAKRIFVRGRTYYVVGGLMNGQSGGSHFQDMAYRKLVY